MAFNPAILHQFHASLQSSLVADVMNRLANLITTVLQLSSSVVAANRTNTDAWKSRSIYFALTDRIAHHNNVGRVQCNNLGNYCGGTFAGLESKLDYIQGMGFDALWITPVVTNSPGGYHGYWAQDLYTINSNYGTADELKSLVNASHDKGIYVMVDVVANHMGYGAIADNRPVPLNQESSYHPACEIDYSDQNTIERCRVAGLPDINTQLPEIRTLYQDWIRWLVAEYSFDGIRIDTVRHVEKDFWPGFVSAAGVYAIGEVFDGNPNYLLGYASLMPGLLNYAIYYPMNNFYQQKGTAQALVDMHDYISSTFPDPSTLGTFLDNHDNPRWLHQKNDISLLKNALAFVMLGRGIPIVYYGTEQGYSGGADPANREDLWRSGFRTEAELYRFISRLSAARKAAGGLSANDHIHLYVTENAYAWSRASGNLIVLTTNIGSGSTGTYCFNTRRPNAQWTLVSRPGSVRSDTGGKACVGVMNGEPVILLANSIDLSSIQGITLDISKDSVSACPVTVSVTFNVKAATSFGDTIKIVGDIPELGSWSTENALSLSATQYTSTNPLWSGTFDLPSGLPVHYKFLRVSSSGEVTWESSPNRSRKVASCQASDILGHNWSG